DTVNDFLSRLDMEELENIRTYMVKELINKKCFYDYRIGGKYWGIIVDGTGLFTFREKHCEHCLEREHKNEETGEKKTTYMHHVLEAKLIAGDMVFSIASEFIENESEDVEKQDCERNAFYRMAKKLKSTFKRLPICIIADSLYACENVFQLCDKNKWKYLIRFKEGSIPSVMREFQNLKILEDSSSYEGISWVNGISYNERTVNVLEFVEEKEKDKRTFIYITNINVKKKNAKRLINAGRSRWKIENEGFNTQKNIRYYIQHPNSHDYNAMKNHYLLTQITDILVQLFENGSKIMKAAKKKAKKKSSNLLRAFQSLTITEEDLINLEKPIQVRFT
ncbi:transposase, partial [Oceanobacillus indicireducens]|uniref:transposase n=1 Tax=Oceanobacillus indicireducens TaxID=1004261 RepID=UPI001E55D995